MVTHCRTLMPFLRRSAALGLPMLPPHFDSDLVARSKLSPLLHWGWPSWTSHGWRPCHNPSLPSIEVSCQVYWKGLSWSRVSTSRRSVFSHRRGSHCRKWKAPPSLLSFVLLVVNITTSSYCQFLLFRPPHLSLLHTNWNLWYDFWSHCLYWEAFTVSATTTT